MHLIYSIVKDSNADLTPWGRIRIYGVQGRNQDLNLTKQKYEILTSQIRIVAKNLIK